MKPLSKKQIRTLVYQTLLKNEHKDNLPKWINVFMADSYFYILQTPLGEGRLTFDLDKNGRIEIPVIFNSIKKQLTIVF